MSSLTPGLHMYEAIEATKFDMAQIGFIIYKVPALQADNRLYLNFEEGVNWQGAAATKPQKHWGEKESLIENSKIHAPIGIYVISQANIQARVATIGGVKKGDDLAVNGVYADSISASTNYAQLVTGIYWGNFDKISIWKPSTGIDFIKVIIGVRK